MNILLLQQQLDKEQSARRTNVRELLKLANSDPVLASHFIMWREGHFETFEAMLTGCIVALIETKGDLTGALLEREEKKPFPLVYPKRGG